MNALEHPFNDCNINFSKMIAFIEIGHHENPTLNEAPLKAVLFHNVVYPLGLIIISPSLMMLILHEERADSYFEGRVE